MIKSKSIDHLFTNSSFFLVKKDEFESNEIQSFIKKVQLPPEKEKHEQRRIEYLLGRYAAHMAHKKLTGKDLLQLASNEDRSPKWPKDIIGAITHNHDYACSTVALKKNLLGIGLDVETFGRTKLELASHIRIDEDLKTHAEMSAEELLTFIFSAKESLYKALYPEVKKFFGFDYAYVTAINTQDQTFKIHLKKSLNSHFGPGKLSEFSGRFALLNKSLFTAIEVFPQNS